MDPKFLRKKQKQQLLGPLGIITTKHKYSVNSNDVGKYINPTTKIKGNNNSQLNTVKAKIKNEINNGGPVNKDIKKYQPMEKVNVLPQVSMKADKKLEPQKQSDAKINNVASKRYTKLSILRDKFVYYLPGKKQEKKDGNNEKVGKVYVRSLIENKKEQIKNEIDSGKSEVQNKKIEKRQTNAENLDPKLKKRDVKEEAKKGANKNVKKISHSISYTEPDNVNEIKEDQGFKNKYEEEQEEKDKYEEEQGEKVKYEEEQEEKVKVEDDGIEGLLQGQENAKHIGFHQRYVQTRDSGSDLAQESGKADGAHMIAIRQCLGAFYNETERSGKIAALESLISSCNAYIAHTTGNWMWKIWKPFRKAVANERVAEVSSLSRVAYDVKVKLEKAEMDGWKKQGRPNMGDFDM